MSMTLQDCREIFNKKQRECQRMRPKSSQRKKRFEATYFKKMTIVASNIYFRTFQGDNAYHCTYKELTESFMQFAGEDASEETIRKIIAKLRKLGLISVKSRNRAGISISTEKGLIPAWVKDINDKITEEYKDANFPKKSFCGLGSGVNKSVDKLVCANNTIPAIRNTIPTKNSTPYNIYNNIIPSDGECFDNNCSENKQRGKAMREGIEYRQLTSEEILSDRNHVKRIAEKLVQEMNEDPDKIIPMINEVYKAHHRGTKITNVKAYMRAVLVNKGLPKVANGYVAHNEQFASPEPYKPDTASREKWKQSLENGVGSKILSGLKAGLINAR